MGIFSYVLPYMKYFIPGLLLLFLGSLLFTTIPAICGELVNIADGKGKYNLTLQQMGLVLLGVLAIQAFISFVRTILFANFSERAMADVRKHLYAKLIGQSLTFYETSRVGDLSSRITADVEQLQGVLAVTLSEFVRQIVTLIAGIAILAWLTPKLSLIMLLTIPIVVVLAMVFGRYIRKLSKERQGVLAETNTIVEETLQNFAVVKAFANEWYEAIRYGKHTDKIVKVSLRFAIVRGAFFAFIIFLMFGSILFILWRGAFMVQQGTMESGDLFSFVMYTVMIGGAIASLGSLYTTIAGAIGATERVQEILQSDAELDVQPVQRKVEGDFQGIIQFDNVGFAYPTRKDVQVLKGIDLNIQAGEKVALVGQSGSGKSTIIQLLMRFYNLSSGRILIDGKDLTSINLTDLRSHIALVPQEVLLFGGSIKENILYGKPDATDSELILAAKQANALEFIESFPEGFETIVGERGIKLSGGQRQRIAIASVILRDPKILILDEATSSLDANSEQAVQVALDHLMEGRTSIIIAHRLSTIKEVDRIYVLKDGKIVETGTHSQLFAMEDGIYAGLAKLQFEMQM